MSNLICNATGVEIEIFVDEVNLQTILNKKTFKKWLKEFIEQFPESRETFRSNIDISEKQISGQLNLNESGDLIIPSAGMMKFYMAVVMKKVKYTFSVKKNVPIIGDSKNFKGYILFENLIQNELEIDFEQTDGGTQNEALIGCVFLNQNGIKVEISVDEYFMVDDGEWYDDDKARFNDIVDDLFIKINAHFKD